MSGPFWLVPAAYVLLRRESPSASASGSPGAGQVLLQLRQGTGFRDGHWAAAAAGHVERGESVPEAARREAFEELGITISPEDLVPLTTMHRTGRTGNPIDERVDFFFECRRWHGEPHVVEPDKASTVGWFALHDLPNPVVPHELMVLEAILAGTLPPLIIAGFGD